MPRQAGTPPPLRAGVPLPVPEDDAPPASPSTMFVFLAEPHGPLHRPFAAIFRCRQCHARHTRRRRAPASSPGCRAALAATGVRAATVNHRSGIHPNLKRIPARPRPGFFRAIDMAGHARRLGDYLTPAGAAACRGNMPPRVAALLAPCREAAQAKGVRLLVRTPRRSTSTSTWRTPWLMPSPWPRPRDWRLHRTARLLDGRPAARAVAGQCRWPGWSRSATMRSATAPRLAARCRATGRCRFLSGCSATCWTRATGACFISSWLGPRIEAEGARAASRRAADYLSNLLTRLGA